MNNLIVEEASAEQRLSALYTPNTRAHTVHVKRSGLVLIFPPLHVPDVHMEIVNIDDDRTVRKPAEDPVALAGRGWNAPLREGQTSFHLEGRSPGMDSSVGIFIPVEGAASNYKDSGSHSSVLMFL